MRLRALLKEPLLHFLLLGALLFALYARVNGGAGAPDEIVVDQARLSALEAQFVQVWQRPPTEQEARGLLDSWIKEEIFYREGVARGLDRDDPIVRRRIGQKLEYAGDAQVPEAPSEAELQAWLDGHPAGYRLPARYSLQQRYFDPQRRGDALLADMATARAALNGGSGVSLGDASLLPFDWKDTSERELERLFGGEFGAALEQLPLGDWQGPLRSSYGLHLVRLTAREPARTPTLADVRSAVERDLLAARSSEAKERFYQQLRQRYSVRLELEPEAEPAAGPSLTSAP